MSVKPEAGLVKHLSAERVTPSVAKLPKQQVHPGECSDLQWSELVIFVITSLDSFQRFLFVLVDHCAVLLVLPIYRRTAHGRSGTYLGVFLSDFSCFSYVKVI